MKKFYAAIALAAVAVAAPALAEGAKAKFTRDGVTYVYTETKTSDATIYKGTATPGDSFYLVRHGDLVTGTANGISVRFRVSDIAKADDASSVEVAAR